MHSRSSTEQYRDQSPNSVSPQTSGLIHILPNVFQFSASKVTTGQVAKVKLKNTSSTPVGYKLKTNAPQKYSVRPVFGVLMPGDSAKVFVRCEGWINPQDRFLLQSIILGDEEGQTFQAATWKTVDPKRIVPSYIQCSSSSALALRDPEDDPGSLSSSSATSSTASTTTYSPSFPPIMTTSCSSMPTASMLSERRSSQPAHRTSTQYQYPAQHHRRSFSHQRPTVSIGAPIPRRVSNATNPSTCSSAASSPGAYPTLFTYNSMSAASTAPSSPGPITSSSVPQALPPVKQQHFSGHRSSPRDAERMETAMEYPGPGSGFTVMVETGLEGLGFSREHVHAMTKRWNDTRQYLSLAQLLVVSFICLLLGVVLPASIRAMVKN
ncbi:Major sperm protein [Podila clonocystis]|nr:Major sperm protein [Podila clonocystis]